MIFIVVGVFSLAIAFYFIRLAADGEKLRKRVWERRVEINEQAREVEDGIIKLDYST